MPSSEGRVLSVNVGRPRTFVFNGRQVRSAIWKSPVIGRVAAGGVNLEACIRATAQARRRSGGTPRAAQSKTNPRK
jgi:MOSC domain-containing protein YiiM